jgi:hypothetical protein
VPRNFAPGDLIASDDPGFKGREHLFQPVEVAAYGRTETATSAPGETRSRTKRLPRKHDEPESPAAEKE